MAPTSRSTQWVAEESRRVLLDILLHPELYYINVHTVLYPGGTVRGDLG
jgi:hypothetical protein